MFKHNVSVFKLLQQNFFTFATKMRQGATKKTKDSAGRRLGIKTFGGHEVLENQIIVRQRGFKWKPGENVHYGRDHTLHSSKEGVVAFTRDPWGKRKRIYVHVIEQEIPNRIISPPKPFMYHPELYPELAENNAKVEPLPIKKKKVNPPRQKKKDFYVLDFLVESQINTKPKKKKEKINDVEEVKREGESMVFDITNTSVEEKEDKNNEIKTVIKPYVYNESWGQRNVQLAKSKRRIYRSISTNAFYIKETLDKTMIHLDRHLSPNTDFHKDLSQYYHFTRHHEDYREDTDEERAGTDDELGESLFKQDCEYPRWEEENNLSLKELLGRINATKAFKYDVDTARLIGRMNRPEEELLDKNINKIETLLNNKKPLSEILEAFKEDCNIAEDIINIAKESEGQNKEVETEGKIKTKA